MSATILHLRLFGPFSADVHGYPMPPCRRQKSLLLLALLGLRPGQSLSRTWLAATLWPESPPETALANLRKILANDLRRALGEAKILLQTPTPSSLRLDPQGIRTDVTDFQAALQRGDTASLELADSLYRGPLLEGFDEEWISLERLHREVQWLAAIECLADMAMERQHLAQAVTYLRRLIAVDPLRENAYTRLMTALFTSGNMAGVRKVYQDLRETLHQKLNAEPAPATRTLFQHLMQAAPPSLPPSDVIPSPGRRIPLPLTPIIGRGPEITEVIERLRQNRLVTLTGAGGIGKTRLALEVASLAAERFTEGAWWVELAGLTEPNQVNYAVAEALGIPEQAGADLAATLRHTLASCSLLLVLDNCEHLLDACSALTGNLLRHCPNLKTLATSRQPLGMSGEWVYRVPSLSTPSVSSAADASDKNLVQQVREYAAVRLFMERVTAHGAVKKWSGAQVLDAATICRDLDGIPLAIEMAAGRTKSLSVSEIQTRLGQRFHLLHSSDRSVLPRHKTLLAALEWSYDLLTPEEQALLVQLSVFSGGWTLEAAEQVCSGTDVRYEVLGVTEVPLAQYPTPNSSPSFTQYLTPNTQLPILDLLTGLVDKSLVQMEMQGERTRYGLLETVRQYAATKRTASGQRQAIEARHCGYFLALAEQVADLVISTNGLWHWNGLAEEHDNLRHALAFCLEEDIESGARLAMALSTFWMDRGHVNQGRQYMTAVLAKLGAVTYPKRRAEVLIHAGDFATRQSDRATARALLEESVTLWRQIGDARGLVKSFRAFLEVASDDDTGRKVLEECLKLWQETGARDDIDLCITLARLSGQSGDDAAAIATLERYLTLSEQQGNRWSTSIFLEELARIAEKQGDYRTARRRCEQRVALWRESDDPNHLAYSLTTLGNVLWIQGEYATARPLFEKCLAYWQTVESSHGIARTLGALGKTLYAQEEYSAACAALEESLIYFRQTGERDYVGACLGDLANVVHQQGDLAAAQALNEESLAIRREIGDQFGMSVAKMGLGHVCLGRGDADGARTYFEDGLTLRRESTSQDQIAWALLEVGLACWKQADLQRLHEAVREAVTIFRSLDDRQGLLQALEIMVAAAHSVCNWEPAACLAGAAEALRQSLRIACLPWWRTARAALLVTARSLPQTDVIRIAGEKGRALTLEQAVDYSLQAIPGQ